MTDIQPNMQKKKNKSWFMRPLTWFTVIIPTMVSAVYFSAVASDVYISESSFVVRSPKNQSSLTGFGALLQNTGFSRSQDDAYTVQEYMRSRTALEQLQAEIPVRSFYDSKGDVFSRFNGLGFNDSEEAFYRYFKEHLIIDLDSVSGIATLRVRAFDAAEGQLINQFLLNMGEDLINRLNERARKDTLAYAIEAVKEAEQYVNSTADALSKYRVKNKIFDLSAQSTEQLSLISKLKSELIKLDTQLLQLRALAPDNPQIIALELRQKSLRKEIEQQTALLSGGDNSITTQTAEYQRLVLSNELAQKQLTAAMTSLQNARAEADRQQLYLEIINQPTKPDWALEPYRLYNILATLFIGLMLNGVLALLIASIREHRN